MICKALKHALFKKYKQQKQLFFFYLCLLEILQCHQAYGILFFIVEWCRLKETQCPTPCTMLCHCQEFPADGYPHTAIIQISYLSKVCSRRLLNCVYKAIKASLIVYLPGLSWDFALLCSFAVFLLTEEAML